MSDRQESLSEELFTPEEQRRVLDLAARLQGVGNNSVTTSELDAAARELGIESRFLAQAARQVKVGNDSNSTRDWAIRMLAAAFLFGQWFAIFGILKGGWTSGFGSNGEHLWLVMGLSLVLGAITSVRRSTFWIGVCAIAATTVVMTILSSILFSVAAAAIHENWTNWLRNLIVVEGGLFLLGGLVGQAASALRKRLSALTGKRELT